jgi:hypothetical protein
MNYQQQLTKDGGTPAAEPERREAAARDLGAGSYERSVHELYRHMQGPITGVRALQRELVRYATLAASSHNTQCWRFQLEHAAISILPDLERRCPVVDPDDHHLFVSLGCAAENLAQAAQVNGLRSTISFDATAGDAVRVALEPGRSIQSPLFQAIPRRQCTRAEYDGRRLTAEQLKLLQQAGCGNGIDVLLLTDRAGIETVLEQVVEGNRAQMSDPAFLRELERWIRFSQREAVRAGDGLFSRSTGNPAVPRWLGSLIFKLPFTARNENQKIVRQIRSSAGIAVFFSEADDKPHWVEAGRCYERFALQATAQGVCNAFLNQPVEVTALRPRFATSLGLGCRRPDLVVRFGAGPPMPRSLRRPIEDVIV